MSKEEKKSKKDKDSSSDSSATYLYCASCKKYPSKGFVGGLCTTCGSPRREIPQSYSAPDVSSSTSNTLGVVTVVGGINSAVKLATYFRGVAWFTIFVGFIAGIGAGYSATHINMNGQTYAIPNAFPHAIAPFLAVFGAACLGAAMLAFFGHVLILLNKIAEK